MKPEEVADMRRWRTSLSGMLDEKDRASASVRPIVLIVVALAFGLMGYGLCLWHPWTKWRPVAPLREERGVVEVIKARYKPPFVPVTLSVTTDGVVEVTAEESIITPVGTFSIEWEREQLYYLEVTLGNDTRFYPLGKEKKFKLFVPNSINQDISVRYDGAGNVRILVPKPRKAHFPGYRYLQSLGDPHRRNALD